MRYLRRHPDEVSLTDRQWAELWALERAEQTASEVDSGDADRATTDRI